MLENIMTLEEIIGIFRAKEKKIIESGDESLACEASGRIKYLEEKKNYPSSIDAWSLRNEIEETARFFEKAMSLKSKLGE